MRDAHASRSVLRLHALGPHTETQFTQVQARTEEAMMASTAPTPAIIPDETKDTRERMAKVSTAAAMPFAVLPAGG